MQKKLLPIRQRKHRLGTKARFIQCMAERIPSISSLLSFFFKGTQESEFDGIDTFLVFVW